MNTENLSWEWKSFTELHRDQLYEILKFRQEIFVVEQNRDAQMKKLILAEANVVPDKMISVLCFDGMPITAHFISTEISSYLAEKEVKEKMQK